MRQKRRERPSFTLFSAIVRPITIFGIVETIIGRRQRLVGKTQCDRYFTHNVNQALSLSKFIIETHLAKTSIDNLSHKKRNHRWITRWECKVRKKNHEHTAELRNERIIIDQLQIVVRYYSQRIDSRARLENRMHTTVRKLERYKYTLNWPRINSSPLERAH